MGAGEGPPATALPCWNDCADWSDAVGIGRACAIAIGAGWGRPANGAGGGGGAVPLSVAIFPVVPCAVRGEKVDLREKRAQ